MHNFKIVFIDIDDTLNSRGKEVSEKTKSIMKKLKDNSVKVVTNTGRCTSYAIDKSIEANLSDFVISSNGAEIYDYKNKKVIFNQTIPSHIVKEIYEYCQEYDLTIFLNSLEKRFVNKKSYLTKKYIYYLDDIDQILNNNSVSQITITSNQYDRMLTIPELFKDKYPELKNVQSSKELTAPPSKEKKEYYHDFICANISKGKGIVELLEYLKLDSNCAICAGDSFCDLSMCDVVEISIAPANAEEILKQRVNYVADYVQNDGVALLLENLCLKDK